MSKELYIAEKPSVAAEFAKALHLNMKRYQGYMESDHAVVTWCVGHLVTMSYPERYDERLKKWSLDTLPFIPDQFLYEVIPSVKKQFTVVSKLLNRDDVTCIYVCTDSGREGEYIYRLVEQMSGVKGRKGNGSGSIHRPKTRLNGASRRQKIFLPMIRFRMRLICAQKKII